MDRLWNGGRGGEIDWKGIEILRTEEEDAGDEAAHNAGVGARQTGRVSLPRTNECSAAALKSWTQRGRRPRARSRPRGQHGRAEVGAWHESSIW